MNTASARGWLWVALALLSLGPGLVVRAGTVAVGDELQALVYGIAILGAAFMLSWAAEVAQRDFSQGLALALLALIAVLPEYVVDASMAWMAATDPAYIGYAVANMTGANRLIIGLAWPLVVLLPLLRFRRGNVQLEEAHGLELSVLLVASVYALLLPWKATISILDFVVLVSMFAFYMWASAACRWRSPTWWGPPG